MPDGSRSVRTLYFPTWIPWVAVAGLAAVIAALAVFSWQSYHTLQNHADNSIELEALRFTNSSQKAQLDIFAERVTTLDRQVTRLVRQEEEVAALKEEVVKHMGDLGVDDDISYGELLPRLQATISWAKNPNGVGGSEQMASALSSTAVGGRARGVIRGMHRDLDRLQMEADGSSQYFSMLKDNFSGVSSILGATPMFLPINSRLSAKFGRRISPFDGGSRELHRGIDIPAPTGTPVRVPANGTVLSVGQAGGYGLMVTVDHGYGLVTRYAHLDESLVEPGDTVRRGKIIARSGNSGRSTGPHLHFETVLGGVAVDPLRVLPPDVTRHVTAKQDAEPI